MKGDDDRDLDLEKVGVSVGAGVSALGLRPLLGLSTLGTLEGVTIAANATESLLGLGGICFFPKKTQSFFSFF